MQVLVAHLWRVAQTPATLTGDETPDMSGAANPLQGLPPALSLQGLGHPYGGRSTSPIASLSLCRPITQVGSPRPPARRTAGAARTQCPLCKEGGDGTQSTPPRSEDQSAGSGQEQTGGLSPTFQRERKKRTMSKQRVCTRLGRWWKKYGYDGPAYCQRCSELFRDHIIRGLSNSASCTLDTPCLDCTRLASIAPVPARNPAVHLSFY